MAIYRTYRCPDCKGTFNFLHHPNNEPPPDRCQLCGTYMGEAPERAPNMINIKTAKNSVGDKLYRQMEVASEERIAAAAELSGGDASDFSHMKVTDMKDGSRPGDITAPSVTESEKMLTREIAGRVVAPEMQSKVGQTYIPQTTAGPDALTTRKMFKSINHRAVAQNQTAAGNMGTYTAKRA